MNIEKLKNIRKHLHRNPELSGDEKDTSKYIAEILSKTNPDSVITNLGGYGIAAVYDTGKAGKTIMFRADMDALPIEEVNNFEHKSKKQCVAHKCGHDGHSTIMLGVADEIAKNLNSLNGKIILLFQPAEETAEGANRVVNDKKFKDIQPDYIFGLHNLPGYSKKSIIIKNGVFASASRGIIISLKGKTSHAAHPENAIYPLNAFTSIINMLNGLPQTAIPFNNAAKVTVINAVMGERAFGTTPGNAVIMATLRSHDDSDMKMMTEKVEKYVKYISKADDLQHTIEYVEDFPALKNNELCVDIIRDAAKKSKADIIEKQKPFPWSEDFSYFSDKYPAGFFGIGSGKEHPQLHNNDYDFPDEIIDTGIKMFMNIANNLNGVQ